MTRLPKPVLDRIRRYAAEGRVLQEAYVDDCYRLLAVANWQFPAVILRGSRIQFPELRNAAQAEWKRVERKPRSKSRPSSLRHLPHNRTQSIHN